MKLISKKIMKKLEIISAKELSSDDDSYRFKAIGIDNTKYLLELSNKNNLDKMLNKYRFYKNLSNNNIPTISPVKFDIYEDTLYTFYNYIDEKKLSDYLKTLSDMKQYELGLVSGEVLKNIHKLNLSCDYEINNTSLQHIENIISKLKISQNNDAKKIYNFINTNLNLLNNRPKCFIHGNYKISSFIVNNLEFTIANFNDYSFDDPYKDFLNITADSNISIPFITGQIDGYFENKIPISFFNLLALYDCINVISNNNFNDDSIKYLISLYSDMQNVVPNWYSDSLKNLYQKKLTTIQMPMNE